MTSAGRAGSRTDRVAALVWTCYPTMLSRASQKRSKNCLPRDVRIASMLTPELRIRYSGVTGPHETHDRKFVSTQPRVARSTLKKFASYLWLDGSESAHEAVNHSERFVRYTEDGAVHTNGVENVWSLFRRGIMGVFHKVSAKHLPLYLNEFEFRFKNRDELNMIDRVLRSAIQTLEHFLTHIVGPLKFYRLVRKRKYLELCVSRRTSPSSPSCILR